MLFLRKNKIGCQVHYKPICFHKTYSKNILLNDAKISTSFYKSQLSLPLHTNMSVKDIDKISNKLNFFFK